MEKLLPETTKRNKYENRAFFPWSQVLQECLLYFLKANTCWPKLASLLIKKIIFSVYLEIFLICRQLCPGYWIPTTLTELLWKHCLLFTKLLPKTVDLFTLHVGWGSGNGGSSFTVKTTFACTHTHVHIRLLYLYLGWIIAYMMGL